MPEDEIDVVTKRLKDEYDAVPVFIDAELAERHYNGFSSTVASGFILIMSDFEFFGVEIIEIIDLLI